MARRQTWAFTKFIKLNERLPSRKPSIPKFSNISFSPQTFLRNLIGHTRQGLRCRICKVNAHADCTSQLPKCQVKAKLLRRQKSTSEIENRVDQDEESEYLERNSFVGHFTLNLILSGRARRMDHFELFPGTKRPIKALLSVSIARRYADEKRNPSNTTNLRILIRILGEACCSDFHWIYLGFFLSKHFS